MNLPLQQEVILRKSLLVLSLAVLGVAGSAFAKTPDGKTPAVETVCDNEMGAAFGLCNAYCEAKDCGDPDQRASSRGCEQIKQSFETLTGRPLPCAMSCPCGEVLQLVKDIESGEARVDRCIADAGLLFVVVDTGDYAMISDGEPAFCSVNAEPPFVELTSTELLVCRVTLRKAAEAQGVICRSPE